MTNKEPTKRSQEDYEKAVQAARQVRDRIDARKKLAEMRDDAKLAERMREALIADLQRVHEHPDKPFPNSPPGRDTYRALGHYPYGVVSFFFGNHAEFQRAGGLRPRRTAQRNANKAALIHTHQDIARFADKHVLKWVNMFDKHKGYRKHLEVVPLSDIHSWAADPFAMRVAMGTVQAMQPEVIVVNGDGVDFPTISRHRKLPGHFHLNVQQEINLFVDNVLRRLRNLCPDSTIHFVIGNHEYRLVTYCADGAPELAFLDDYCWNRLFKLEELEINLVARSSFMAPTAKMRKQDRAQNWVKVGGVYVLTHGTSCAKNAAAVQLDGWNMSGTSGHTHRPQIYTKNSEGTGGISWMSTPVMANPAALAATYVWEKPPWMMGFGHASVFPGKAVSQHIVQVHEEHAAYAGMSWKVSKQERAQRRKMLEWMER